VQEGTTLESKGHKVKDGNQRQKQAAQSTTSSPLFIDIRSVALPLQFPGQYAIFWILAKFSQKFDGIIRQPLTN